jgi:hypothetical protein
MIYLYGLLSPRAALDADRLRAVAGVTGPVEVSDVAGGTLIHGPADTEQILPRRRHLLAHTRVLEACLEQGDLLPMRFGMVVPGLQEIERAIAAHGEVLRSQFDRVAGRAEFSLKISFPRPAALDATLRSDAGLAAEHARLLALPKPPHFAAAEFGRRLAEMLDRRRGAAQKKIIAELLPLCHAHVLARPETDVQVLHLHALLPRDRAGILADAAQAAAVASGFAPGTDPETRIIGPVPPFNFVQLVLDPEQSEAA